MRIIIGKHVVIKQWSKNSPEMWRHCMEFEAWSTTFQRNYRSRNRLFSSSNVNIVLGLEEAPRSAFCSKCKRSGEYLLVWCGWKKQSGKITAWETAGSPTCKNQSEFGFLHADMFQRFYHSQQNQRIKLRDANEKGERTTMNNERTSSSIYLQHLESLMCIRYTAFQYTIVAALSLRTCGGKIGHESVYDYSKSPHLAGCALFTKKSLLNEAHALWCLLSFSLGKRKKKKRHKNLPKLRAQLLAQQNFVVFIF